MSSFNGFVPKTLKIDFPRYDGRDDPTMWLCKAEKYFTRHEITDFDKVLLASFHLEGDAQLWFQILEELIKLRQTRTVVEFQTKFERLLARVGSL
ncbi:hypothetical protein UlMin_013573 [Ulmus minor]